MTVAKSGAPLADMATAAVARPAQALRQRRDIPRPVLGKRTSTLMADGTPANGEVAPKRRRLEEPYVRTPAYILKKFRGKPPSMVIHLHNEHFRFDGQEGSFAYNGPMRFIMEHLKAGTVPHEMLAELLADGVAFYDGCLIVEIRNHRTAGASKAEGKNGEVKGVDAKFSMHAYNEHVTPSPFVPYPTKARTDELENKNGAEASRDRDDKSEQKDNGPKIYTAVLFPTQLSHHCELLLLASTPASELRGKKKGATETSQTAQPPTPSLSIPPTPLTSRGPLAQNQKMCLEEADFNSFQADVLVATEAPLFLDPVSNPQDADRVLDLLSHPSHNEEPPSPKTRKRTTAEMAADDAQNASIERRWLIFDDRKPSNRTGAGAAANDNQGTAAALGFSRFKTLEMVRQKHEEQERLRKEEDDRRAAEKRLHDEQNAARIAQLQAQKQTRPTMDQPQAANAAVMAQRHALLRAQQNEQRMNQARQAHPQAQPHHGHPNVTTAVQPQQHVNFQHPNQQVNMLQGSPVMRQQTPAMMNSSPMMPNGSFPMAHNPSQGAGSPGRPGSAVSTAVQNRNVQVMARQASQQRPGSQNNTPQVPQGTPGMMAAVPNRQMTATPRLPPSSPAVNMQSTPMSAGGLNINMQTPLLHNLPNLSEEQIQILNQQRALHMQAQQSMLNGQAGSPNAGVPTNMTVDQFQTARIHQEIRRSQMQIQARHQSIMAAVQQQGGQPTAHQQQQLMALQRLLNESKTRYAMSVNSQHQQRQVSVTPQIGHAHPQTPQQIQGAVPGQDMNAMLTQQAQAARAQQIAQQRQQAHQQQQAAMAAQQMQNQHLQQQQQVAPGSNQFTIQQLASQFGGDIRNIPQQIVRSLTQPVQRQLILAQTQAQGLARQRAAMQAHQLAQNNAMMGADQQVPASTPNPVYMAQLRQHQAALLQNMSPGGQGNMMGMPRQAQQQQGGGNGVGGQQQQGPDELAQRMVDVHNAINGGRQ